MWRRDFTRQSVTVLGAVLTAGVGGATGQETASFDVLGRTNDRVEHDADAGVADGTVTVEGRVAGPDACVDARLRGVERSDGALRIIVERTRAGDVCAQVLTAVRYRATVPAGDATVVTVEHVDGAGERLYAKTFDVASPDSAGDASAIRLDRRRPPVDRQGTRDDSAATVPGPRGFREGTTERSERVDSREFDSRSDGGA